MILRTLFVTTDKRWYQSVAAALRREGFDTGLIGPAQPLGKIVAKFSPDALLWDFSDVGKAQSVQRWDVLKQAAQDMQLGQAPHIVIGKRDDHRWRKEALIAGAEDCLSKTSKAEEIALLIKAVIERRRRQGGILKVGILTLDPLKREVHANHKVNRSKQLAPKEFEFLYLLASRCERLVGTAFLQRQLKLPASPRAVETVACRVRKQMPKQFMRHLHLDHVSGKGWKLSVIA